MYFIALSWRKREVGEGKREKTRQGHASTRDSLRRWIPALASLLGFGLGLPSAQTSPIENANIRSWTTTFSGWNMEADQYHWVELTPPAEIKRDKILGLSVLIYSDAGTPEVFNLTRQSGRKWWGSNTGMGAGRSGGWAEFIFFDDGRLEVALDRGPCARNATPCRTGTGVESFFAATSSITGSQTFPQNAGRVFKSMTKVRGSIKVDYACTVCGSYYPNRLWTKLGGWDMKNGVSRTYLSSNLGVDPKMVVGMSAVIHSDPDASGKIQVDNLEHISALNATGSPKINRWIRRPRGGTLWYGVGCYGGDPTNRNGCLTSSNISFTHYGLRLWQGPVGTGESTTGLSMYATGAYENGERSTQIFYTNQTVNRGWVKLEYNGSKVGLAVPYVFRQRAYPLNAWNMASALYYSMPFSNLNLAIGRIAGITSTILSDYAPGWGITATNFHRPPSGSGAGPHDINDDKVGGFTLIDEAEGAGSIILNQGVRMEGTYYSRPLGQTVYQYTSNANRGYVLVDYLAGSCDQGGSGLLLRAIPAPTSETCTGTGNLVLQASGSVNGINGTRDDFVYAYKQAAGTTHTTIARLASQDNFNANALSGIMIRSSLNDNARFVAALVKPWGGGYVRYRNGDGQNAGQLAFSCNANPWLRIDFAAPNFYIYYSNSSTMPSTLSQWTYIGPVSISSFPSNSYYVGAASTNANHSKLQKSTFVISSSF